ncbi:MAG: methyltransferase domain-containing protein [Anaerolineae bacterium]|nr:methyltransferase domain-containing protein [Anaerolineae bacterium]
MEKRKLEEIEFHNKIRDMALKEDQESYQYYWSNRKFYSITRKSIQFYENWLIERGQDKKVLDYCCGDGDTSITLAKQGFQVVGIDISNVSIENCRQRAIQEGLADQTTFYVMDAEKMEFDSDDFDLIICNGVLHHLDLNCAFPELARVLKPEGEIICIEPLAYNPFIQLYRKRTPHLRTEWEAEHILTLEDLDLAQKFFGQVEVKFFHLATLAAVPFRNMPWFDTLLSWLEAIDEIILKLPLIQMQAWQMIFTLSQPGQPSTQGSFTASKKRAEKKLLVGVLALAAFIGAIWIWRSRALT